ncbi:MAG: hypothetical protein FD123_403 [Bacteroidetes bacterium]|nr:MAG: hypothetical protein FD123_403 [Bacteroidota bacterium]
MRTILLFLLATTLLCTGTGAINKEKPCSETFSGKRREIVKTNIASGVQTTITISELYNRPMPSEKTMKEKYKVTDKSGRSEPEKENVTIICWLYTYVHEGDGDYHLIIGSSSDKDKARFFSAEISGLPKKTSINYKYYNQLKKARDQFKSLIADYSPCPSTYVQSLFDKPMKIEVTGNLYWDTEHAGGSCCSGTTRKKDGFVFKSESPWEIHPVTEIHPIED